METTLDIGYFAWLTGIARGWCFEHGSYDQLIHILQLTPFYSPIPMDKNRIEDGINLRARYSNSISKDEPASVLEVMMALAYRCEEEFMADPDYGDREGEWFFGMIQSLGLDGMTDDRFNLVYTMSILDIFLKRQFKPNGEGSLFTVKNSSQDFRKTEIWYQMCWYLDEITG